MAYGDTSLEFIPGRYVRPGYTITSRGCPRRCWFCGVWRKWPEANVLPIHSGWNVLDDNLLACPPERPAEMKYAPGPEWRGFQRRWARPAIIHASREDA